MSEPFEQAVLAAIADVKSDINRQGDRHDAAMKKLFDIHQDHAADDIKRFESIDEQFAALSNKAAEARGSAATTAKTWGIVGGIGTVLLGALGTFLKYFHGAK